MNYILYEKIRTKTRPVTKKKNDRWVRVNTTGR